MKPWNVRLREECEKIRSIKGREKWGYIWDYYKIQIVVLVFVLWMTGSIINDTIINPPPSAAVTIAWMGFEFEESLNMLREALYPAVAEEPGSGNQTVQILTFFMTDDPQQNMAQHTRFSAMMAAGELDIVIGPIEHHEETEFSPAGTSMGMAPSWAFSDIRSTLSVAGVGFDEDELLFDEDQDQQVIAFAAPLEGNPLLEESGIFTEGLFLGVIVNSQRDNGVVGAISTLLTNP